MRARQSIVRLVSTVVMLVCLLAFPALALADDEPTGKIDPSVETILEATGGIQAVPVIVSAPGAAADVAATLPLGVQITNLPIVGGIAAFLTPEEIDRLGGAAFVSAIAADNPVFGFDVASSMDITNLTIGLGSVAASGGTVPNGAGVAVAVIDSGVAATPDLAGSRIVGWKDFVNGESAPYDDAGHGTFVAGLIAGDGTGSLPLEDGGYATVQFRGVAPAANIVGIKVLDETGQGRTSSLIAGIAWAIEHKADYGIKVINISIGGNPVGPINRDPVAKAVEIAWRQGIVVVCAAGNEGEFGPGGILSPGNSPFVITVGSTDTRQTADVTDDAVAFYSSVGPTLFDEFAKPDMVAPGNRLISLRTPTSYIDTNFPENVIPVTSYAPTAPFDTPSSYLMLSGTSGSTPLVAGTAALMLSEDPTLTPGDVKTRLMVTADPVAGASRFQQGAGTLDAAEALTSTATATGYALTAYAGGRKSVLKDNDYKKWEKQVWSKYGWTKFKWTKFKWTKFKWTKSDYTDVAWTKFKWTKFKWTQTEWTKFKWTEYEWTKFKWTVLLQGQ
jgi:serine protease AprX